MSGSLRLSDISPARQILVRSCQRINRGSIEGLEVHQSEPVFDPAPVMVKDLKLDKMEAPRPELGLGDFILCDEIVRLLSLLDEIKCGVIRFIEIRDGIPRRMLVAWQQFATAERRQTGSHK
jgi:hypothetical protein